MIRVLNSLVAVLRARPVVAAPARRLPRTRPQVESLEERCLLSWGTTPPLAIQPADLTATTVALNAQDTADITADEIDFYTFEVPGTAPAVDTYAISVFTPVSSVDTVLGVYNAAGLRIASNDDISSTDHDSRVFLALHAGERYYFGVSKLAGTPGGSYTWAVEGPADFQENNDDRDSASDLGMLSERFTRDFLSLTDGHDWYQFTMKAAGTAGDRVALHFTHSQGDLQLELTDAAGNRVGLSAGTDDTETISLDGLAAGTYFVHVFGENGAANPRYQLEIDPGTLALFPLILDGAGSGGSAGAIKLDGDGNPVADQYEFQATVTGRVSILIRADRQFLQSLLTVASPTTVASEAFVAGQFPETQDHLVQFDVVVGEKYRFSAGVVVPPGEPPNRPPIAVGPYRLYLSTEAKDSDFSSTIPHRIALDASGFGLQLGTLESPGDEDLFAFTATVTGRTTVRIDGGADEGQEFHFLTKPGETYAVKVFDPSDRTGVYALTVTSIADDFPDNQVTAIKLDATGSGHRKGTIDYAGDADVFRFTANHTGTMTVLMQGRPGVESFSTLVAELSVTSALPSYEFSPTRFSSADRPATDRILQFQVVQGQRYTIRASGAEGTVGDYLLSFAMAVDDAAATRTVDLAANLTGSIETPQDQDRFQFTADFDGFVIVALEPTAGTNMQGLLTVPSLPAVMDTQSGPGWQFAHFGPPTDGILFQAVSESGWEEDSRHAFLGFVVQEGHTYEFLVSGNQTTIGEYQLSFSTYRAPEHSELYGFGDTFLTRSATRSGNAFSTNVRFLKFIFDNLNPPLLSVLDQGIAPVPETGKTPGPTNTRLVVFALPGTNGGNTPGTVTVPNGPATATANSLLTTLLTVAARDNAVRSTENTVASLGASELTSTLLASVLVGVTSAGGSDAAPVIAGTVFEDIDGNGRPGADEPGVAGEQVVLEVQQNGQYVVVATATTDARGAYAFAAVPAGEYRVRRITEPTGSDPAGAAGQAIKVTGDGKPQTLNFGKPMKRGKVLDHRVQPPISSAVDEVIPLRDGTLTENLGRAFQEWASVGDSLVLLDVDAGDQVAADVWLGLLCLAPAALVSIAHQRTDADEKTVPARSK